jgi:hypothetical protein
VQEEIGACHVDAVAVPQRQRVSRQHAADAAKLSIRCLELVSQLRVRNVGRLPLRRREHAGDLVEALGHRVPHALGCAQHVGDPPESRDHSLHGCRQRHLVSRDRARGQLALGQRNQRTAHPHGTPRQ